jgi:hypothetical protein
VPVPSFTYGFVYLKYGPARREHRRGGLALPGRKKGARVLGKRGVWRLTHNAPRPALRAAWSPSRDRPAARDRARLS